MTALNDEPPVGTRVDPLIFELRAWHAKPLRPPAPTAGCEKTACPVVWEGGRAQSPPPQPDQMRGQAFCRGRAWSLRRRNRLEIIAVIEEVIESDADELP